MPPWAVFDESRSARALVVGTLAVIPAALVVAASRLGPGMTNDSVTYAATARNFAETGALNGITGAPLTVFPPALPAALGLLARMGLDVEAATVALDVVCVILAVVATYWLAKEALGDPALALVPTAIVSVSTSTLKVFSRMWTEPPFIVLTLVLLIALTRAVRTARLTPAVVSVTILATALAGTVRYIGLALIPIAALGSALAERRRGIGRMVTSGVLVAVASSVGLVAVMARSLARGTGATGDRLNVGKSPIEFIAGPLSTFGTYLVPEPAGRIALLVGVVVAALLGYGAWRVVRARDSGMATMTAYIGVYWLTMMAIALVTNIEDVRYRYAAPVFAPLAILATFAARDLLGRLNGARATALRWCLVAALVLALPLALAQSAAYSWITGRSGHGYNSLQVRESALAAAVSALPSGAQIATNDIQQVYWVSGRRALPYQTWVSDPSSIEFVALFDDEILGTSRDVVGDPADQGLPVKLIEQFADGRLYQVLPPP